MKDEHSCIAWYLDAVEEDVRVCRRWHRRRLEAAVGLCGYAYPTPQCDPHECGDRGVA